MLLVETALPGAYLVEQVRHEDARGSFARTFDAEVFREAGLDPTVQQCSVSFNSRSRTLRGMHMQSDPYGEAKLIRCTRGKVFDVLVDLRPELDSFGTWVGFELDEQTGLGLFAPPGVAHGFLTLEPNTELSYQISTKHHPEAAVGFRWDDPDIAIDWPNDPIVMSDRDRALPSLAVLRLGLAEES